MATLVKTRTRVAIAGDDEVSREDIESGIPETFPLTVVKLQGLGGVERVDVESAGGKERSSEEEATETAEDPLSLDIQDVAESTQTEMHPSMLRVQQTCLSTLNNLLMPLDPFHPWRPIIPPRRHSMPHRVQDTTESCDYPLITTLENLRSLNTGEMIQIGSENDIASLYKELRGHVQRLSPTLSARDAELAFSLVTLVSRLERLSMLSPNLRDNLTQMTPVDPHSPVDMYDTLSRQVSSFQLSQMGAQDSASAQRPSEEVEAALLWHHIDADFENVLRLCHQPSEARISGDLESLPPGYEDRLGDLPGYEFNEDFKVFGKENSTPSIADTSNEKMKLELESVVMSIERMYLVAPQLHNQRAELRHHLPRELDKSADSSEAGPSTSTTSRTKKDSAVVELILKSANRRYVDQTYVLSEGGMKSQIEKTKQKDRLQREVFVENLIERTSSGRLVGQDASAPVVRVRDPEEMISLPEFMREPVPKGVILMRAKSTEEPHSPRSSSGPSGSGSGSASGTRVLHKRPSRNLAVKAEGLRQRSHSLSSLARLFPGHRSPSPRVTGKTKASEANLSDLSEEKNLKLQYIAEYQENLQTIVVLVQMLGVPPANSNTTPSSAECKAEVRPWTNTKLFINYNYATSLPLTLPVSAKAGSYKVTTFPGNASFDIKLPVDKNEEIKGSRTSPTLLTAEELEDIDPSSFICTSCSLPIIRCRPSSSSSSSSTLSTRSESPSPPKAYTKYFDLPSEQWSELMDAWMCHPSQQLTDAITKHAQDGIWPRPGFGQVFLGVSYVVVCEEDVVQCNLRLEREGEEWTLTRCLCGAMIGKCKEVTLQVGGGYESYKCYRFAKYSIRPVSPTSEHVRLSLPAFFVEDMHCIAQVHANWRFVIYDDEEGKPRFLIWLFKPSIMMSWSTPTYRAISGEGKQLCAKVLYKILDSNLTKDTIEPTLNQYPNFSRAEPFYYPMSACRTLMALLKDSNRVFPEEMRQMAGLDIGFLERAHS